MCSLILYLFFGEYVGKDVCAYFLLSFCEYSVFKSRDELFLFHSPKGHRDELVIL